MKRGRSGDTLTGGTKDVNPQWLTFNQLTLSAANTYTETTFAVPISRLPTARGKSVVLEVLKVQFSWPDWDSNPAAGGQVASANMQLRTNASGAGFNQDDPVNLTQYKHSWRGAFTAAGSYMSEDSGVITMDLTDGAGHGLLVASDNLFFGATTANYANAAAFHCRILYRFKDVTLEEYIGIVQSQQ